MDDGRVADDGTGWEVTSSSSQPSVMASMLESLRLEPGMSVLEIGTGTGWNAALIASVVGAENVTTVEIDPVIGDRARLALDRAGFEKVTTIIGDGTGSRPGNGPYDRTIATAGAFTVPVEWVRQTVPGCRIVVPMNNTFEPLGIVTFEVVNSSTATGRIGEKASFMHLRSQRVPRVGGGTWPQVENRRETDLHPYRWAGNRDAAIGIGLRLGSGIHKNYEAHSAAAGIVWLRHPASRSWASVEICDGPPYTVEQAGPMRLMDEVLGAYRWWIDAGSPALTAWHVTVTDSGQRVALDLPPTAD